jgi:hypothetical protein
MTHTQGPWVVKLKDRKWVIKGPDKKHSPVALVELEGFGMGPSRAVREANARLIAAAPRMYAALEALIWQDAHFGEVNDALIVEAARLLQEIDG